jgi:hypothetical protein
VTNPPPLTGPTPETPELPELDILPARPQATAFILGAVLIAITGGAVAMLFLVRHSKVMFSLSRIGAHSNFSIPGSTIAAAIGIIFGLLGLKCLVSGNALRLRLIYGFTTSAYELTASLVKREVNPNLRLKVIEDLSDYECALLRLGAYDQALQVSRWIVLCGGRSHKHRPDRGTFWDRLRYSFGRI